MFLQTSTAYRLKRKQQGTRPALPNSVTLNLTASLTPAKNAVRRSAILKQGTTARGNLHARKLLCHDITYSRTASYPYKLSATVAYPALPLRNTLIAMDGNSP